MGLPFKSQSGGSSHADPEAPLSVSELVSLIAETLERAFQSILVVGELTSFKRHHLSGHCYFTLSDDVAAIDGVMWRSAADRLKFDPRPGDEVICRGRIAVYEKQGRMQLYATAIKPVGEGAAQRAFEELKRKLEAEGLFAVERKRPLPVLPRTIGVVTSRSGAALHDILTTVRRRFPYVHVLVAPAAVQGADAPSELCSALELLADDARCEVVVVGRGGGAAEDLAAFNDERLVRAVAGFPVPVVSAVGHETDFSLCDLAADHRAATPTAAAEAVTPVYTDVVEEIVSLDQRLHSGVRRYLAHQRDRLGHVGGRLRDPASRVAGARQRVDEMAMRLERSLLARHRDAERAFGELRSNVQRLSRSYAEGLRRRVLDLDVRLARATAARHWRASRSLVELGSKLDALSPLAVLERGYALAAGPDGRLVRAAAEIARGDVLDLRFRTGRARTQVVSTSEDGE